MASRTYTQHYVDGSSQLVRRIARQGRKALPPELVKVKMDFRTLAATKVHILAEAQRYGITPSRYIDLAVALFDIGKFSCDEITSTQ